MPYTRYDETLESEFWEQHKEKKNPLTYSRYDTHLENDLRDALKDTSYGQRTEDQDVRYYVSELRKIMEAAPLYGFPPEPSLISDNVYLGTVADAENVQLLRRMGITYILNCAGIPTIRYERETRYKPEHGIVGYEEIPAEDGEFYDISRHFLRAHRFIDCARIGGSRVLIYCPDVNRSGAIAFSYLLHRGISLIQAAKELKSKRKVTLFNRGFMKQLVIYARDRGLLEHGKSHLAGKHMDGITRVRDRNSDSHLLSFLF